MANVINGYQNQYNVANAGINQQQIDNTINKSKEAVSTTVENNALLSSTMGIDKEGVIRSLPLIGVILFINNILMSGKEEKSLVGKFAKIGDKISDTFKFQSKGVKLKPKINKFANGRFVKYFGDDYKAIHKNQLGKTVKMSEKYAEALVDSLSIRVKDLKVTKESPVDDIIKAADDYLLKNPNSKHIQGLKNMLNAADLRVGKTNLGKALAKGGLKFKEIAFSTSDFLSPKGMMTLFMDFFSIVLFANVLKDAIKESKEAPKGEKLSTFTHILFSDWAPLMVWQPATKLAYKLGGNKYRGMGLEERKKLADIVKTANNRKPRVSDAKIVKTADELLEGVNESGGSLIKSLSDKLSAKAQQKLLWNGVDESEVLKLKGKSLFEVIAASSKLKKAVPKDVSKMMKYKKKLFDAGVSATDIAKLDGKTLSEAKNIVTDLLSKISLEDKNVLKVANIQKNALLKGAKAADVDSLVGKTAEEATQAVKGFAKNLDLKWWERPLKAVGTFLASSLDDIASPSTMGKIGKKIKGFGSGAMRFVLILFVLQPLLQKPITKLGHMIFGKPETYLKKKEAEEKTQENNTQSPQAQNNEQNGSSTNLLEQRGLSLNNQQSQIPASNQAQSPAVAPSAATGVSPQIADDSMQPVNQDVSKQEDPSAALNLFKKDKNEYKGYIPSIEVNNVDNSEQEIEQRVNELLKETDKKIARLKSKGF